MKTKYILTIICAISALPISAQFFNFSLRTNSQQLIDEALSGAFVKVTQSYELCDTISGKRFGRDGKDYFSKVPFVGVKTECGLIVSSEIETPWSCDEDFNEYEGIYKPFLKESSTISSLNAETVSSTMIHLSQVESRVDGEMSIINDSAVCKQGLCIDSIAGQKNGWIVWVSSDDFENVDSVKLTSISKPIEVPIDGKPMNIELPEVQGNVYGGIYVIPIQTTIGQITLCISGFVVRGDDGWKMTFPFVKTKKNDTPLTPISDNEWNNIDQIKKMKR